jgi:hypothetical protein
MSVQRGFLPHPGDYPRCSLDRSGPCANHRDTAFGKIQGTSGDMRKRLGDCRRPAPGLRSFHGNREKERYPAKDQRPGRGQHRPDRRGRKSVQRFAGAFVSFFRELPYEKIGISAVLENDVFRINGTIRENGKEYLIKKGGFSGVDVIIGSPGSNTISFKDMVNRIKRRRRFAGRPGNRE